MYRVVTEHTYPDAQSGDRTLVWVPVPSQVGSLCGDPSIDSRMVPLAAPPTRDRPIPSLPVTLWQHLVDCDGLREPGVFRIPPLKVKLDRVQQTRRKLHIAPAETSGERCRDQRREVPMSRLERAPCMCMCM